jgi:hypothetical protein
MTNNATPAVPAINGFPPTVLILAENCAIVRKSMQYPAVCREALFF